MMPTESDTKRRLIAACIKVISAAAKPCDVTVRAIACAAATSPAALYGHYASLDDLVIAAAKYLYTQVNHDRMLALQRVVDQSAPGHPSLRDVLAALIGPPVRWSLDPSRPYAVFRYINTLQGVDGASATLQPLIDQVDQYRVFVAYLQRAAPWFDEVDIGWRINAALGVRTQVLREPRRTRLLTHDRLDLQDPDNVIEMILDVVEPMFLPRAEVCRQPAVPQAGARRRAAGRVAIL
jgi:AcrR family transcriptional regulator